jgi:branched-chain amino acid transport system substrate-binding protein
MGRYLLFLLAFIVMVTGSGPTEAEVRIGFANPLTGPYALSGHRNRVAVETAVHDLNRRGGVLGEQVQLVTVDDACGLEQTLVAARKLIAAGVRFVVGHLCSHSSLLAAGVYETADVLMISPDSTHPRLTEEGRGNVFRLVGRDDQQGQMAADLLAKRWAGKKIAILHDGTTYGEGLAAETRKRLRQHGVTEAIYDAYGPGAKGYSALIDRLKNAGIEILYIGGYGRDAGLILRTARERGDRLQLVGGDGLGMDGFWAAAGPAGSGTIFSARPDVRGTAQAAEVLARFQRRGLGIRPGGIGAYAAVQVWAQAVERAGTTELVGVASMLRRGRFETVLGPIAFDGKGDLRDAGWQWKVWANADHVPLFPHMPLLVDRVRRTGDGKLAWRRS